MKFAGRRILVVEDDFLVSLDTIEVLKDAGCTVVGPAADFATAMHLAQSELLDAAILDVNIAGKLIWPVAEELNRRGVTILILSAYPKQSIAPAAFAAVPRLGKPLERGRLLDQLSALWGGRI